MLRLSALLALTMCAFAANSVLNRIGVSQYGMDPMLFAVIRVAAGAAMLWVLMRRRGSVFPQIWSRRRMTGALALSAYMIGFSWAYTSLDAGLGALILFGVLQVVIFAWAVVTGQMIPPLRWLGACVAFAGLLVLLWPNDVQSVPLGGAIAMAIAGSAWAIYTLLGRGEPDALASTAVNFLLCLPLVLLTLPLSDAGSASLPGVVIALVAGSVTSGLGYALWYRILPQLPATLAGIAQLSVPVLTIIAGVLVLSEPLTTRLVLAALLVLGGIAISLPRSR